MCVCVLCVFFMPEQVNIAGTMDVTGSAGRSVEVTALSVMSKRLTRIERQSDT